MKGIINFFKESGIDWAKGHVKLLIESIFLLTVSIILSFIKIVNSIELTIKLPLIITFLILLLLAVILIIELIKKCKILKKQNEVLLDPPNENVNKFHLGDIVILKIEKDLQFPEKLTVIKLLKSEILCRNKNNEIKKYIPEEILTKEETNQILRQIKTKRLQIEQEQEEFTKSLNDFYSF